MSRLQKKCFISSVGVHLLLLLVIVIGPAFLSSRDKADAFAPLNFIPVMTVDAAVSGGGNPNAKPPPPAPPTQEPPKPVVTQPPEPKPEPKPEPVKVEQQPEPPKITQPSPDAVEPVKPTKHKVEVNLKQVTRTQKDVTDANAATEKRAQRAADQRRQQLAAEIGQAASDIRQNLSGSTTIELQGPGGGGVPYANWLQAVKSVYDRAWVLPPGVKADSATAQVTVTIARDGTVISARIVGRSGNSAVDESVQRTIDNVRYAAPLPESAKEDQRTITIYFDVKSKLLG